MNSPLSTISSASALALMLSSNAFAQEKLAEIEVKKNKATEIRKQKKEDDVEVVTVTGSRLMRNVFSSPSPIEVINVSEAALFGFTDIESMLNNSTSLMSSEQLTSAMSSADDGANGGQGSSTANLRGLGAGRTLSLLNGRRAGPAGIRDGVSSFDMNVIPLSGIETIEILKDGASSIYGSDAIGGVINYITKKGDGGEVKVSTNQPQGSGGDKFQISASYGQSLDRGYWRVTADYNRQKSLYKGQRSHFNCKEEYLFEHNSNVRADVIDPLTGENKCLGFDSGSIWIYDYATDFGDGTSNVATGDKIFYDFNGQLAAAGLLPQSTNADPNNPYHLRLPEGYYLEPEGAWGDSLKPNSGRLLDDENLIPKSDRFTVMASGEYDITDNMTMYAEAMFNRRKSSARYVSQTWAYFYTNNWSYYTYGEIASGLGDPLTEGFTGAQILMPIIAYSPGTDHNTVDYTRFVLGLEGFIGDSDWSYDVSGQYSKSDGEYQDRYLINDAWRHSSNRAYAWGGNTASECESFDRLNLDGSVRQANIPCMDIPWTSPRILAGEFNQQERDYLFGDDVGNTTYTNKSLDIGLVNNELFELPAGNIGIAIGGQYMSDALNDTPGIESLTSNTGTFNGTQFYQTKGDNETKALYAELAVPLLHDLPVVKYLELGVSGRRTEMSFDAGGDHDSDSFTGDTYKLSLNWVIDDSVRIRASRGTSFRSPALYELFRENLHSSKLQSNLDPCYLWGDKLADGDLSQRIADNCASEGVPMDQTDPSSASITTGGGAGVLVAETSISNSYGIIFTPEGTNFRLSIDHFDVEINDEVDVFGAENIVKGCYNSEFFPEEGLCDLFTRDTPKGNGTHRILTVKDSYINVASQRTNGWDIEASYATQLPYGINLKVRTSHTFTTEKSKAKFTGNVTDKNGRAGSPDWVGSLSFIANKGDFSAAWHTRFIGSTFQDHKTKDETRERLDLDGVTRTYDRRLGLEQTIYHNLSLGYRFGDGLSARFGVTNVFDKAPPQGSHGTDTKLQGAGVWYSQYDWKGRRFSLSVSKNF